jgi:alpha-D-ribose 1-methylphosphonate 5-triphosphate synthase subunit PhnH
MNAMLDLAEVGSGFSNPVMTSQAVFRAGLHALSRPGTVVGIDSDAEPPQGVGKAACAMLLSLLDLDTSLWIAPSFARGTQDYFRFHTGCVIAGAAPQADFLLIGCGDALPTLGTLRSGNEYFPEHSTTVIREVSRMQAGPGRRWTGPGIDSEIELDIPEVDFGFVREWRQSWRLFPRGVDIFLTCGARLCGLPRTTQIHTA